MNRNKAFNLLFLLMSMSLLGCTGTQTADQQETRGNARFRFMILAPGHFHASLVLKNNYDVVDTTVNVYAPEGPELQDFLARIKQYNTQETQPTNWNLKVYTGPDFMEKMLSEKPGNVMITAGNNQKKTEYIKSTVDAGINVLADKPMAIDTKGFELLKEAFASAEKNNVLLYDIMTERYEITTMLQREFSTLPEIFGELEKGTPNNPAVTKESVHHFNKIVSGKPLQRPAWFMDVTQQGEGIVDVTTHLVDLIQWECFPEQVIDYENEIEMLSAKRWPTKMTPAEFQEITSLSSYPDYLKKDVGSDNVLNVYANGEINYKIRGIHAKVSVIWNYKAPEGTGDTHYSIMRGTKANLVIRQGEEQGFIPQLYIEPAGKVDMAALKTAVESNLGKVQQKFNGIEVREEKGRFLVVIPDSYRVGHEAHFSQVTEKYLGFLEEGKMPSWEVPNMIAKYYVTTKALELAKSTNP